MTLTQRVLKALRTPPRRFQIGGVHFIEHCKGRCIIADEMGLGKTIQAIAWAAIHPEISPIVIICPAGLKYMWQEQLMLHAGLDSEVVSGHTRYDTESNILIINYDILKQWRNVLCRRICPRLVIIDECHYIKNTESIRTKICRRLSRLCDHLIALSGTPIQNRPIEFYPILNMINHQEWSSKIRFGFKYCEPTRGYGSRFALEFNGAANLEELHRRVSKVMIRRKKEDVLHDLPKKQRTIIPIDIPRSEYEAAENDFINWYKQKKGEQKAKKALKALSIVKINTLKRIACEEMLPYIYQWIDDFLESDQKLIVVSIHQIIQNALRARYKNKAVTIDTLTKDRQTNAKRFQNDPKCRLMLGGLTPIGTGWTLTAASNILLTEVSWVPGDMDQVEDRIHRIGQKATSVNAWYLVPRNTVVEDTINLHQTKRSVISQVVDGKEDVQQFEILSGILAALRRRHER